MTTHRRWTQTDISYLRSQLEAGEGVEEIALGLSRLPEAVRLMMGRLKLRTRDAGSRVR